MMNKKLTNSLEQSPSWDSRCQYGNSQLLM